MGDALVIYIEMEENDQKDIDQIEAWLKEAFADAVFTVYRKVWMFLQTRSGS